MYIYIYIYYIYKIYTCKNKNNKYIYNNTLYAQKKIQKK